MHLKLVVALAIAARSAKATIRFGCSQLVTERFDPVVTPGQVSPHVHQVVGGNAFNLTMDPALEISEVATCTTCRFKENFSNYWTAPLYFKHANGSFLRVPQFPNHLTGEYNGGMTVYYIPGFPPFEEQNITAFPKGFRMITGNPFLRSMPPVDPNNAATYAVSFRCWEDQEFLGPSNSFPPGMGPYDTLGFPNKPCLGGIRSNTFFPSCWDGIHTDVPDHHSHMSFPTGPVENEYSGIIWHNGSCPESHPVRVPTILLETAWDTRPFNSMWPEDGSQPFVLSQGDPTGFGHHADYLFGWEGDSLQRAMNSCFDLFGTPENCTTLALQTDEEMNSCTKETSINEVVEGEYLLELPGCNPLQYGPEPATMLPDCDAISTTGFPPVPTPSATRSVKSKRPRPTRRPDPRPTRPPGGGPPGGHGPNH